MSENKEVAIKVEGVYKDFNLPHELNDNLKQKVLHPFKRTKIEKQHALKDISFEINKGDFFGIVGRNGSGKSTLLKIIAGIYAPTKGSVSVNGSLTPFIELGVGFNAELTGRENVFLNGAMLGFSKREMEDMYNEIVEFAELEKFMDQKLKNYSSGMQVRLAFSVAIRAKSDILLLDEVLAVGDSVFQQKCFAYFKELKRNKQTVVFITHDMEAIKKYCNKCVLIKDSVVTQQGNPIDIGNQYLLDAGKAIADQEDKSNNVQPHSLTNLVKLTGAKLLSAQNMPKDSNQLEFEIVCKSSSDLKVMPAMSILKLPDMNSVAEMNFGSFTTLEKNQTKLFSFQADLSPLNGGSYAIHHCLFDTNQQLIAIGEEVLNFNIPNRGKKYGGVVRLQGNWS